MAAIVIRRAVAADAAELAALILHSAEQFLPAVFGGRIGQALPGLARRPGNLFSHAHALIAARGDRTVGAILGYTGSEKAAEDPTTGLALLLAVGPSLLGRLGRLLVLRRSIGLVAPGEWYVSNVAVFPGHRGLGVGRALMEAGEGEAARAGCARMVLDVETDHAPAIGLYRGLGYVTRREGPPVYLDGRPFSFLRMERELARDAP